MTLAELIADADLWPNDATIYAAMPWRPDAAAALVGPDPAAPGSIRRDGVELHYFLESAVAREVLATFSGSPGARCSRLIGHVMDEA